MQSNQEGHSGSGAGQRYKGVSLGYALAAEKEYTVLLASGDLKEIFPRAKGEWEKDKKWFISQYEEQQRILNDLDVHIEPEEID